MPIMTMALLPWMGEAITYLRRNYSEERHEIMRFDDQSTYVSWEDGDRETGVYLYMRRTEEQPTYDGKYWRAYTAFGSDIRGSNTPAWTLRIDLGVAGMPSEDDHPALEPVPYAEASEEQRLLIESLRIESGLYFRVDFAAAPAARQPYSTRFHARSEEDWAEFRRTVIERELVARIRTAEEYARAQQTDPYDDWPSSDGGDSGDDESHSPDEDNNPPASASDRESGNPEED